jgi:hypothetical protein
MKGMVLQDVTTESVIEIYGRFRLTYCLRIKDKGEHQTCNQQLDYFPIVCSAYPIFMKTSYQAALS